VAHHTEQVGLQALPLPSGMIIKLEARSPTTDAEVAGVTSTRWSIYGYDETEEPQLLPPIPILILPGS
jgi:hypothetical protein